MNPADKSSDYWSNIARIVNFFRYTPESGFLFCACNNQRLIREINKQIIGKAEHHGVTPREVYLSFEDLDQILPVLRNAAQESPNGIIINNLDELILRTQGQFIRDINMGREILIDMAVPMLFWVSEENISRFANQATDLFNRRDRSVICFSDVSGIAAGMERLDDFYSLGFKDSETYNNLSLKIELMEKQLREAKEKKYPEDRIAIEIVADLIGLYLQASLYPEAFALFEDYEKLYSESNKIKVIYICSDIYSRKGQWDISLGYLLKLESIQNETGERGWLGTIFNDIGVIYHYKGEWNKALEYYLKSEQIRLEVGHRAGLGVTYNNIGLIYSNKGEWDKAMEYYLKSQQIYLEMGDRAGLATTYISIGAIYRKKGELDKALEYYLKSEQIRLEVGDRAGLGVNYSNIGDAYNNKGQWDKAMEYILKSEQIRLEVGDRAGLGTTYNIIGTIYFNKGEWDKAMEYYLKSEQIRLEVGDKIGLRSTYNNIGVIYYQKGELDNALEYYHKDEQISFEIGDRAGLVSTFFNIGTSLLKKKNKGTADIYLTIAGYIAKTQEMKYELSQMAWALNPLIEEMGEEQFMEEGRRLFEEKCKNMGNQEVSL